MAKNPTIPGEMSDPYPGHGPALVDRGMLQRDIIDNPRHFGRWRRCKFSRNQLRVLHGLARGELNKARLACNDPAMIGFYGRSDLLVDVQEMEYVVDEITRAMDAPPHPAPKKKKSWWNLW